MRKSSKLAKSALFYVSQMINLHGEELPVDVRKYHNIYSRSLKPFGYKVGTYLLLLYPSSSVFRSLTLPKSLYFLYITLRPLFILWRALLEIMGAGSIDPLIDV